MKTLKIVWAFIWNLTIVMVTIGVLSSFEYSTESPAAVAVAFIILVSVNMGYTHQMRTMAAFTISNQKQNAMILRALGKNEDADDLDEDCDNAIRALASTKHTLWISIVGACIVWLAAAFALLGSLST